MIELRDIEKTYRAGDDEFPALKGIIMGLAMIRIVPTDISAIGSLAGFPNSGYDPADSCWTALRHSDDRHRQVLSCRQGRKARSNGGAAC